MKLRGRVALVTGAAGGIGVTVNAVAPGPVIFADDGMSVGV